MTLKELKRQLDLFESDGRQALEVHLTPSDAKELRKELRHPCGMDPGEDLIMLYGVPVVSIRASETHIKE